MDARLGLNCPLCHLTSGPMALRSFRSMAAARLSKKFNSTFEPGLLGHWLYVYMFAVNFKMVRSMLLIRCMVIRVDPICVSTKSFKEDRICSK